MRSNSILVKLLAARAAVRSFYKQKETVRAVFHPKPKAASKIL